LANAEVFKKKSWKKLVRYNFDPYYTSHTYFYYATHLKRKIGQKQFDVDSHFKYSSCEEDQ